LLPLSKLNAALSHIGQSPVLGKSEAIIKLTSAINSGLIDLAKVQSATPVPIVNLASSTSEGLEQNMLTLKSEDKLALELMVR
jgi:hypothetical protein